MIFLWERGFASFVGCKLAANTPWLLRGDPSLWQTQKGAGKVADVPKSPKTHRAHPSWDQDVGTGLAPIPSGAVPVWETGNEMAEGSAEVLLG